MTPNVDILALGEAMLEFVKIDTDPEGRALYRQGFGGDTSNAIIAAARQGATTGYLSAVGGDPFGEALLDLWTAEGVSTRSVRIKPQDPTGSYFVLPDPAGRKFSYARRGSAASLFGPSDIDEEAIASAKVLHVSALSQAISPNMREAVQKAAEIARSNDTLVSYDTNLRLNLWTLDEARATIDAFLPLADIVLPSDDEAETLTGTSDQDRILEYFGAHNPKVLLLKRGAQGPLLRSNGQEEHFAVPSVKAIDSTGAGDSFAGGFLAYFLETGDAAEATRRAMKVAAGTVSGFGAVDPIPRRADIV